MGRKFRQKLTTCLYCKKSFYHQPTKNSGKYCSLKCAKLCPIYREKQRIAKSGVKQSLATRKKRSESMKGTRTKEKNPSWRGEKVKFRSLHSWIVRNYGKATMCEFCGDKNKKLYDWSNKKHDYTRDISSWQQLCRGCHMKYDIKMGFRRK